MGATDPRGEGDQSEHEWTELDSPMKVAEETDPIEAADPEIWMRSAAIAERIQVTDPPPWTNQRRTLYPPDPPTSVEAESVAALVTEAADQLARDIVTKVNAGAALAYALYHSGGKELVLAMPDTVLTAYARAIEAYSIGRHNPKRPGHD